MSWSHLPHQTLATVTVAGVSLALFFWIGRVLGSEVFGHWNVLLTWATLGMLLVDGGFRVLIFREGAGGELRGRILDLAFGHWMMMVGLAGLFFVFFLPALSGWLVWGALAFVLVSVPAGYRSAWLKAAGRFRADALWQVQCRLFSALAIVIVLLVQAEVAFIFWAWVGALLLCLATVWPWLAAIRPRPSFTLAVYRPVAALLLIEAATLVYLRADILLLGWLGVPAGEIGRYAVAAKVLEGVALLSAPVAQIFFRQVRMRWLADTWSPGSLRLPLLVSLGVAAGLVMVGIVAGETPWLWLLGPDYLGVGGLLPWLLAATIFMLPNALLTQTALATHGEWHYARAALLAACANIALNLWWIPWWGVRGAAAATVVAEGLLMLGLLAWSRRQPSPGSVPAASVGDGA